MLKHYKYPLKVWLTASGLGTILFYLYNYTEGILNGAISEPVSISNAIFFGVTLMLSALFAAPAWLLLWWIYWRIETQHLSKFKQLLILLIATQLLCWSTFYVVFSLDDGSPFRGNLDVILPYSAALIIPVLVYQRLTMLKNES